MFIPFMFTQSRGSYLALPFVYMTFGFLLPSKRIKMVVLAVVFVIFGVLFMPATVTDRIMYTFEQGYTQQKKVKIGDVELDTSTTERLESWTRALSDGIKSPIWGFGVTGYGFLDAQYPRIWVETGLLGLFFFGSLMYKVFKQGFQLYGNTEDPLFKGLGMGLIAGTVGLLFHALGANTFMIVRVMEPFWLIVGMVVFANKLEADAAEVVENDGDVRAVIVKTVKTA
jgi:O-antigen ligase